MFFKDRDGSYTLYSFATSSDNNLFFDDFAKKINPKKVCLVPKKW
jgi:hypothetical protein